MFDRIAPVRPVLQSTLLLAMMAVLGSAHAQTAPPDTAAETAQSASDTLVQARTLLAAGQAAETQALLMPLAENGTADNQTLFLLAMAAKAQGDWPTVKTHLNAILAKDPAAHRVKLELAEAHFRSGEAQRARQLLNEVKASNPPPKVGENIDAFLAFIQSGTPRLFSSWASIGLLYDTNANQGPDIDTVLMYNLPFTLDKDAKGNSDTATVIRAGSNANYALNDQLALQAGGSLYHTNYLDLNRYDALSLSMNAGPSLKHNDWSFSLPYILNVVKIGHASDWYQISNGFAPQFGWQLDRRISLQGSLAWQDKRYRHNGQRNGHSLTFSPSLRYGLNTNSYASVGAYKGQENSGIQTSANDSLGLNLGYYKAFNQSWNLYAAPSWSKTDYDGIEAAYGTSRRDRRLDFTTNLNYLLAPWGANVTLSYTHTHNRSSIAMYRYKRQQMMVSVAKNF